MTIFALSSGKGRAGVSIIRVSGPATKQAILSLTATEILPVERMATLRWFYHPLTHEKIDQGIVVFFPGPKSFTGEDVAEFHIHGGNAVIEQFLTVLSGLPNLRMAEAGEFTRRAFDNDKMDLTADRKSIRTLPIPKQKDSANKLCDKCRAHWHIYMKSGGAN